MVFVTVKLVDGDDIRSLGIEEEDELVEAVKLTVERFLQAEGQGSFVVDTEDGWVCIPTRSIRYITVSQTDA